MPEWQECSGRLNWNSSVRFTCISEGLQLCPLWGAHSKAHLLDGTLCFLMPLLWEGTEDSRRTKKLLKHSLDISSKTDFPRSELFPFTRVPCVWTKSIGSYFILNQKAASLRQTDPVFLQYNIKVAEGWGCVAFLPWPGFLIPHVWGGRKQVWLGELTPGQTPSETGKHSGLLDLGTTVMSPPMTSPHSLVLKLWSAFHLLKEIPSLSVWFLVSDETYPGHIPVFPGIVNVNFAEEKKMLIAKGSCVWALIAWVWE